MVDLTRESIEKAIQEIERNPELRKGRESKDYDLVFDRKKYPPILVLSEASKFLGGSELFLHDFNNSTKNAFKPLRDLGFDVVPKNKGYFDELIGFLEQAESGALTTSNYLKEFQEFKVKVSFGQGVQARIPWIAFLGGGNTVSNGIYPVYLYFKSKGLLILAYGISETNTPLSHWRVNDTLKIKDYFAKNNLGNPERYGDSYVFRVYNTAHPLNQNEVNEDLNEILSKYRKVIESSSPDKSISKDIRKVFNYSEFHQATIEAGLFFDKRVCLRFVAALLSKPFVILTGLSGSGKTKLAQAFSKWISESNSQICIVPIGADWTNREPLLGYPNALDPGKYVLPENGALSLLIEASKIENQSKPYFLILDEMNLSHVERYFADFLSAMESKESIPLHPDYKEWLDEVPSKIAMPKNLFIIGTVNIDETTYMFSPKVLDRANVIEFRVKPEEMEAFLINNGTNEVFALEGLGKNSAVNFIELKDSKTELSELEELNSYLLSFFTELKKVQAEFGYRTAFEISKFAGIIKQLEPSLSTAEIIDAAIMQKLLPKVHGSRRKLEPVLKTIGAICITDPLKIEEVLSSENIDKRDDVRFPISLEKIQRMYQGLIYNGFTSYAEA